MASAPNPLASPLAQPQGPGPQGGPPGAPPQAPPPPPPPMLLNPAIAPPQGDVYLIDPLVLERPVKIKIEAGTRMVNRERLNQVLPMVTQFLFNPAFMGELARLEYVPDMSEVTRMFQEASGLGRTFNFVRPMTPQEKQARSQPPPEVVAEMQQAQLDAQVRREAMQTKSQTEIMVAQIEAAVEQGAIDEKSAMHLMTLMQKEQSDKANKPDPALAQMELAAKMREKEMDLQFQQKKGEMDLQAAQAKTQQQMQAGAQKLMMDGIRNRMQLQMQRAQKPKAESDTRPT